MRISAFNRSCERKQSHIYPSRSLKKVAISFDHDPILFSAANPADEVFGRHSSFVQFDGEGDTANARARAIGGHPGVIVSAVCRMKAPGNP
jgi:hypothetical protein